MTSACSSISPLCFLAPWQSSGTQPSLFQLQLPRSHSHVSLNNSCTWPPLLWGMQLAHHSCFKTQSCLPWKRSDAELLTKGAYFQVETSSPTPLIIITILRNFTSLNMTTSSLHTCATLSQQYPTGTVVFPPASSSCAAWA